MKIFRLQPSDLKIRNDDARKNLRACFVLFLFLGISAVSFWFGEKSAAQEAVRMPAGNYRVGEKLTYNFSFENFKDVAYAELFVASRGKLEGRNAVELRENLKRLIFSVPPFI